ncbi:peptidyl-prolyl cis-trans isomerase, FKBP-type [Actinomyces sp. ICM58]|uniref:FKBP-type peptidyl-prolyl cis-trans isomerase n=1 Tax=unclassified Actinomyces TaxID=2609248 RepID=UPI00027725E5|nr:MULTISPECIES: FKBP-type peptidyl-prolyl cis-trans isomerase [unclassified Actinomyces]EJN52287.1 peptidyl-prolyl cis-trans isomerase, FKBP-type [Actinomyces sp. ICM58]
MMSPLRRLGALVGAAALVLGLAACNDLTSSSTSSQVDYAACATDDSELQNQNVDRTGKGAFPDVTGDDSPVIAAGKGSEPTDKVLVKTLKQGDGALVCPGATIKANYVGTLWDGTVFDSSYKRGEPSEFSLDQVVKGWTYGLAHTHVGDRVELIIPASLGYGNQARGNIPANSTLVFVVDVLGASTTTMADESVLTGATATGEELPAGVTVTGDPGVEPTLAIDESVAAPTERKIYTIYKGSGEELADGESFLYRAVAGGFGANGQTQSSWSQAPVVETVTNAGLAGFTVGSRILLVVPIPASQTQSGTPAQASVMVVDIVGTSTME